MTKETIDLSEKFGKKIILQFQEYAPLLRQYGFDFVELPNFLVVGAPEFSNQWLIYITATTANVTNLLKVVLPYLKAHNVAFKLLKNQFLVNKFNGWAYGESEVGKVIRIFTSSSEQARELQEHLEQITLQFEGIPVPNALRIGKVLYALSCEHLNYPFGDGEQKKVRLYVPPKRHIPFRIPKQYQPGKRKRIIGKYYVPIETLSTSPKGTLFKAINMKRMACQPCFIKQGNELAAEDFQGRDVRDRLKWQAEVLQDLRGVDGVPQFIGLCESGPSCYLVMEFIEGKLLKDVAQELRSNYCWADIPNRHRVSLLSLYLKVLQVIKDIHNLGYIHRDITHNNFKVTPEGKIGVLDFELTYNVHKSKPNPPFTFGTLGYVAPEQYDFPGPSFKEDIYSLGALLIFLISGEQPAQFIDSDISITAQRLSEKKADAEILNLAIRCIDKKPAKRPAIVDIITTILKINHFYLLEGYSGLTMIDHHTIIEH